MSFSEKAQFITPFFNNKKILIRDLLKYFDFVELENESPSIKDIYYILKFNDKTLDDVTQNLFDEYQSDAFKLNTRLMNNMIVVQKNENDFVFVGQINKPEFFVETEAQGEYLSSKMFKENPLSIPIENMKNPLYSYIKITSCVHTRQRGKYYCIFYSISNNIIKIYAASENSVYNITPNDNDDTLDKYTKDSLLYIFALSKIVFNDEKKSNHYQNTFITASVRKPDDVFFNKIPLYDVTFITGNIVTPLYIHQHLRKKLINHKFIKGENITIPYPNVIWPPYFSEYKGHESSNEKYGSLEIYSELQKTNIVFCNRTNFIIEALTHDSLNIYDVVDKILMLYNKGTIAFGQYVVHEKMSKMDIINFVDKNFKNKYLSQLIDISFEKHKQPNFEMEKKLKSVYLYNLFQKLYEHYVVNKSNKNIAEVLNTFDENLKKHDLVKRIENDITDDVKSGQRYDTFNDTLLKNVLIESASNTNKSCIIKHKNFYVTCDVNNHESKKGFKIIKPVSFEYMLSLGADSVNDINTILSDLINQHDDGVQTYRFMSEKELLLKRTDSKKKYRVPKQLLEELILYLYFGEEKYNPTINSMLVEKLVNGEGEISENITFIRTTKKLYIENTRNQFTVSFDDDVLLISDNFLIKTGLKKDYVIVNATDKLISNVATVKKADFPISLLYMVFNRFLKDFENIDNLSDNVKLSKLILDMYDDDDDLINDRYTLSVFFTQNNLVETVKQYMDNLDVVEFTIPTNLTFGPVKNTLYFFNKK